MAKIEARLIGPDEELGDNTREVTVFGQTVSREYGEVTLTPEQHERLKHNRYIELRGAPERPPRDALSLSPEEQRAVADQQGRETAMRARLTELGESVPDNASMATLERQVDRAERKAAREAAKADAAE